MGKLIHNSIECAKMETEIKISLVVSFKVHGSLCEEIWVKHICKYVYSKDIVIKDKGREIKTSQEKDSNVTSHFIRSIDCGCI